MIRATTDDLYLAIAFIKQCNFACGYCHPFGESKMTHGQNMSSEEIRQVVDASYDAGFRVFRFTGGECTIVPWFEDALRHTLSKEGTRVNICTNGSTIERYRDLYRELKERISLRVSLDTFDEGKRALGFEKVLTPQLARDLEHLAQDGVYTRFNTVVTSDNVDEVPDLIRFAASLKFDVKLLDLYVQDQYIATHGKRGNGDGDPMEYWRSHYVDLLSIIPALEEMASGGDASYNRDGGFGIPMYSYRIDGITVILKDSTRGAHFSKSRCVDACPLFLKGCQEGVYTPHVSSNMVLHINGCAHEGYRWPLRGRDREQQIAAFHDIVGTFFHDIVPIDTPPETILGHLQRRSAPVMIGGWRGNDA